MCILIEIISRIRAAFDVLSDCECIMCGRYELKKEAAMRKVTDVHNGRSKNPINQAQISLNCTSGLFVSKYFS